jgi:hypothetical protein
MGHRMPQSPRLGSFFPSFQLLSDRKTSIFEKFIDENFFDPDLWRKKNNIVHFSKSSTFLGFFKGN